MFPPLFTVFRLNVNGAQGLGWNDGMETDYPLRSLVIHRKQQQTPTNFILFMWIWSNTSRQSEICDTYGKESFFLMEAFLIVQFLLGSATGLTCFLFIVICLKILLHFPFEFLTQKLDVQE